MRGSDNCFFFFLDAVVTVDVPMAKEKKKLSKLQLYILQE